MVSVDNWSVDFKSLRTDFDKPRFTIKLCQSLKNLNPTDKLSIADWLIKFRAAAGDVCSIAFAKPVQRDEFRLHFNLAGEGFWNYLEGWDEVEFFDDLYARYLVRHAFINGVVASFLIGLVEWEKEPALARCIRSLPGAPGWAATGNGMAIYDWLAKHGSTDDAATQELLSNEWSAIVIESCLTKKGFPRTATVFQNSSAAEDVVDRLAALLDLYEKVPDVHRGAPSHIFIKVMVQLLSEDVPPLRDWGSRFIIDLLTGCKTITRTRSEWVADEASNLIRAILPQRSIAFTTALPDSRPPGALKLQRAGASNGQRSFQSGTNRPPFQAKGGPREGYKGKPKGDGTSDKIRFGQCSFCDARGCQNADDPKAGIDKCSVFGGCPCKPNALPDEKQYVELSRKFLKDAGPKSKYHSPPYLKGMEIRSNVWQFTKDLAQHSGLSIASPATSSSSGVRISRENRLRQVGKFRTMAAASLDEGDTEGAAYLYKCADRMEQDDSDDEDSDETSECAAVNNLAAADNEFVGAFNRLAQVDAFDRGAFKGAEELLGDIGDVGELSTMQGVGHNWDVANAYVQYAIEPVEVDLSPNSFQRVAFGVDHALKEFRRFDRVAKRVVLGTFSQLR